MRHVVVTRSVYAPHLWPTVANRRRLDLTAAVTVRSLAAQGAGFEWHVAVHPDDELLEQRKAVFEQAGVPVVFHPMTPDAKANLNRAKLAVAAYGSLGPFPGPTLSTRLDDDDAFTADAFTRLRAAVSESDGETAWLFPMGHRVWGGRFTEVRHESNAMSSLWSPKGRSVVSYLHRLVRQKVKQVRWVDEQPAWLWVRSADNLDKWKEAYHLLTDEIRGLYPVDWTLLDAQPLAPATAPRQKTIDRLP